MMPWLYRELSVFPFLFLFYSTTTSLTATLSCFPISRKEDYIPAEKTPPLGIYRIHVLKIARRFGLASAMLDAALSNCVYGMSAEALVKYHKGKSNTTAFSQPTQAGRYLAEAWIHSSPNKKDFPNHQQLLVFDEGV